MHKKGLTLGKFAPLHRGHQFVIETGIAETDEMTVAIYDAPETTVPSPVRSSWISQLYPNVRLLEAWDGPTQVGYTPEIGADLLCWSSLHSCMSCCFCLAASGLFRWHSGRRTAS